MRYTLTIALLALMTTIIAARAEITPATRAACGDGDQEACEMIAKAEASAAKRATFKPWQRIWQCNDIRVTETVTQPGIVNYDLGGTIWGGSQFTLEIERGNLYFNGRPCLPLRPVGY